MAKSGPRIRIRADESTSAYCSVRMRKVAANTCHNQDRGSHRVLMPFFPSLSSKECYPSIRRAAYGESSKSTSTGTTVTTNHCPGFYRVRAEIESRVAHFRRSLELWMPLRPHRPTASRSPFLQRVHSRCAHGYDDPAKVLSSVHVRATRLVIIRTPEPVVELSKRASCARSAISWIVPANISALRRTSLQQRKQPCSRAETAVATFQFERRQRLGRLCR